MINRNPPLPFPGSQREAWEIRYRVKGRQWGNAPVELSTTGNEGVILELGVGDGKNLRARRDGGVLPVGIDFSLAALHLCRSDPTLFEIPLLLGDVCHLPICTASVHHVFAHHILGHILIGSCEMVMDEVYRVLEPGGITTVTVFATGDMRDGTGVEVEPSTFLRGDGIITRYFTHEDMVILSGEFTILDIRQEEWSLRIRGLDKKRAILIGTYQKMI